MTLITMFREDEIFFWAEVIFCRVRAVSKDLVQQQDVEYGTF